VASDEREQPVVSSALISTSLSPRHPYATLPVRAVAGATRRYIRSRRPQDGF